MEDSQAFNLELEDSPSPGQRKVIVRRLLNQSTGSLRSSEHGLDGSRQVLLARKIRPGQTIQLKAKHASAKMREDQPTDAVPETLLRGAVVPEVLPRQVSILGPHEDFLDMSRQRSGAKLVEASQPELGSKTAQADPSHSMLERMRASQDKQARLMRESAQRAMKAQESALRRYDEQTRSWHSQMVVLSKRLGVPSSHLMMGRIDEYRSRVEECELIEQHEQHTRLGSSTAWKVGLRESGTFYEPLGHPARGMWMKFSVPDGPRLTRVRTLPGHLASRRMLPPSVTEELAANRSDRGDRGDRGGSGGGGLTISTSAPELTASGTGSAFGGAPGLSRWCSSPHLHAQQEKLATWRDHNQIPPPLPESLLVSHSESYHGSYRGSYHGGDSVPPSPSDLFTAPPTAQPSAAATAFAAIREDTPAISDRAPSHATSVSGLSGPPEPEFFDVEADTAELERLRTAANFEGRAPAHLSALEKKLWATFMAVDTDGSGSISKSELYQALSKIGLDTSSSSLVRTFKIGDTDGDGRIDCEEFIALGKEMQELVHAADALRTQGNSSSRDGVDSRPTLVRTATSSTKNYRHPLERRTMGPALRMQLSAVQFETEPGKTEEKVVELENTGSTVMHYECRRLTSSNTHETNAAADAKEHFFVNPAHGRIMPGQTAHLNFSFCSARPAIYTETWQVVLTPRPSMPAEPAPQINVRGVCLAPVDSTHAARVLERELAAKQTFRAMEDILLRDVLSRVHESVAAKAAGADPTAAAFSSAASSALAAFERGYAAQQHIPTVVARMLFDTLDAIAAAACEGGAAWGGDVEKLEAIVLASADSQLIASFSSALDSGSLSMEPMAAQRKHRKWVGAQAIVHEMVAAVGDAAERSRTLYHKPPSSYLNLASGATDATASYPSSAPMVRGGVEVGWCWETASWETLDQKDEIEQAAKAARLLKEEEEAKKAEWEEVKSKMSKRDRKKAEDREKAEEEAKAKARAEAGAVLSRQASEGFSQDPVAAFQKEYAAVQADEVRQVVASSLMKLVDSFYEIECELPVD